MTRLLNASNKFLQVIRDFGYPDVTLEQVAADSFYQEVGLNLCRGDIPEKFLNEIVEFIKSHYSA